MFLIYLLCCLVAVRSATVKESVKDEHCTDPRTMRKHAAYTEWADAYSCTRHRCQPGGRNLAIYTVGCKRVEAPESAIECEEVVEDTNMQFPYCCTRLRCLVVVRGEVWTRVLGQPWETLPAAPWSHMYKMKKPPPVDSSFLPKGGAAAGPVYELSEDKSTDRRNNEDCDKPVARAQPMAAPDIIALTTNNDKKPNNDVDMPMPQSRSTFVSQRMEERNDQPNDIEAEETPLVTEKVPEVISEERMFPLEKERGRDRIFPEMSDDEQPTYRGKDSRILKPFEASDEQYLNKRSKKQKPAEVSSDEHYSSKRMKKQKVPDAVSEERMYSNVEKKSTRAPKSWAKVPQEPWNPNSGQHMRLVDNTNGYDKERETVPKVDSPLPIFTGDSEEKQEKPASLQHLVNAIGTRMRDIENVVQQMSEKVQPPLESMESAVAYRRSAVGTFLRNYEKAMRNNDLVLRKRAESTRTMPRAKDNTESLQLPKKPYNDHDDYNRFPQGGSKYLRTTADSTTEPPLFVNDNLNGYFSDPSNNLLRRSMRQKGPHSPKEPQETYMAPINTDHKKSPTSDSDEPDSKHKKHMHKKKKPKHGRKKHHRDGDKKKFTKILPEFDKNGLSQEDSIDFGKA